MGRQFCWRPAATVRIRGLGLRPATGSFGGGPDPLWKRTGPVQSSLGLLQIGPFLGQDRPLDRADLKTDAAIDAGIEVNPEVGRSLAVGPFARVDAGHRAGINAISDALADVGDDRVGHGALVATWTLGSQPESPGTAARSGHGISPLLAGQRLGVEFSDQPLLVQLALGFDGGRQTGAGAVTHQHC